MANTRIRDFADQSTWDASAYFPVDDVAYPKARRLVASIVDDRFVFVTGDTMTGNLDVEYSNAGTLDVTLKNTHGASKGAALKLDGTSLWQFGIDINEDGTDDAYLWTDGGTGTRMYMTAAETAFNQSGADVNHRIESDDDINMFFLDAGNNRLGLRTASPSATLHVDQSDASGGIPPLLLDQADIDVEFVKFVGSSEDGQADRSLVDVADMTTPGALTGWIQVYIEDVQSTNPITDGVYYIPFYGAPSA